MKRIDDVERRLADSPAKHLGWMNLESTTKFLTQTRSMVVSAAVLATVVALATIVVRQLSNDAVVVQPIAVPASLVDEGFTPEVASQWIVDRMLTIQSEAKTRKARRDLLPDASRLDFEMPGSGVSVKAMGTIIRRSLGISEATLSGERGEIVVRVCVVELSDHQISLRLAQRVEGHEKRV